MHLQEKGARNDIPGVDRATVGGADRIQQRTGKINQNFDR
jgi:hypothetical protein